MLDDTNQTHSYRAGRIGGRIHLPMPTEGIRTPLLSLNWGILAAILDFVDLWIASDVVT